MTDNIKNRAEPETVDEKFLRLFNRKEFYGKYDFERYSELADQWWEENNPDDGGDGISLLRPVIGGIVYV